ncbi:bifunctional diaminohydroxyphosphoribosylaminopyrimidine deaminase/5-amino-6-(5-phosphoribosylamino)uracil reductase RibD [Pseudomonas qingdaonensis]|uniref:bifunctional diaminohydroxyphosphoribosylaminopyrimidine deaminase/5-amino-6-(5-phosphoribosylamino)uracil reductase RibD n=1 Tax=Pseudomonas qingdaonensis TaxID=2056231 RepID=UPI00369F8316
MPILPSNSDFMQLALIEGRRALPACRPNPPVGCVMVRDHQVISQGHTQPPGQPHAEAMALAKLPEGGRGVTAYVTLEPCSFQRRTPSCALALIDKGVERVFVGMLDPDPRNAGAGVRLLRQAGVEVIVGLLAEEVSRDLRTYLLAEA